MIYKLTFALAVAPSVHGAAFGAASAGRINSASRSRLSACAPAEDELAPQAPAALEVLAVAGSSMSGRCRDIGGILKKQRVRFSGRMSGRGSLSGEV